MNTSTFALVVLSSLLGDGREPNYNKAQAVSAAQKKPLALIFGSGPQGWSQIATDGKLDAAAMKLLAENYVCLYADTGSSAGKALAAMFDIERNQGVVLSDRTGNVQAFHHDGQLGEAELAKQLQHFAAPDLDVRTTLTNANQRSSYYFGSSSPRQPVYAPATFARNC